MTHTQRALRALLVPFSVTAVAPSVLVALSGDADTRWDIRAAGYGAVFFLALTLTLVSALLFGLTVRLFAQIGRGTLLPWDPPQKLVIEGPYQYVRNPMILSVLGVLLGEALLLGSSCLALWAAVFFALSYSYFVFWEEPRLLERYGDAYETYRQRVPRWLPHLPRKTAPTDERRTDGPTYPKR